jgi:uncharacterized membrane protein YeaQ/YmgE (transglycosylase-associated protein family)
MLAETMTGFCMGLVLWYLVPDSKGIGMDTIFGLVGGGVGAYVYHLFGHRIPFDLWAWNAWSLVSSAAGAALLVLVVRAAGGRRTVA